MPVVEFVCGAVELTADVLAMSAGDVVEEAFIVGGSSEDVVEADAPHHVLPG